MLHVTYRAHGPSVVIGESVELRHVLAIGVQDRKKDFGDKKKREERRDRYMGSSDTSEPYILDYSSNQLQSLACS